jgi:hemerythrin-like metal-binding protein
MLMILMWTDNLSVGVKYFDEDHKRLIRMINELHFEIQDAAATGKIAEDEIELALHRLENYFEYHCLQEEIFMEKVAYPGIDEHRHCHQIFFNKVAAMSCEFTGSRDPAHAIELMQFIYDWVIEHIHTIDKKYSDYLFDKKIGPADFEKFLPGTAERKRSLSNLASVATTVPAVAEALKTELPKSVA